MIEKITYFFSESLWNFPLSEERGVRKFYFKWLRILCLSVRGFIRDNCSLSASSLTYYTMMSIVPVLAMVFAVALGFGYHQLFRADLLNYFQDQNIAIVALFEYADSFLEQAKGGLIAGIGTVILFVTVILLLSNLERVLNQIWGAKKLRSWQRVFSDYFALMLISPVAFIIASSASVFVVSGLKKVVIALFMQGAISSILLFLINLIPYCLFWLLFSFIFVFIPNTKVYLRSALVGGLFSSVLYVMIQWGYIYFQKGMSSYGLIYGSMAALPLFLISIQMSWFLLLFGAEISHAHQTLKEHEFEGESKRASLDFKRALSLWIFKLSIERFLNEKSPIHREMIANQYHIPLAFLDPLLQELIDAHLLLEVKGGLIPGLPSEEIRISDCLNAIEAKGKNEFSFIDSKRIRPFAKAIEEFRKQIESSPYNQKLKDVSNPF